MPAPEGVGETFCSDCLSGWLARVTVSRGTPCQSFGFAFVGNARQDERVTAGLDTFHRLPLPLLTHGIHPARFSVDCHPINDPNHTLFILSHAATLPPNRLLGR